MDLCFVDVETTGLDPVRHELIELVRWTKPPPAAVLRGSQLVGS